MSTSGLTQRLEFELERKPSSYVPIAVCILLSIIIFCVGVIWWVPGYIAIGCFGIVIFVHTLIKGARCRRLAIADGQVTVGAGFARDKIINVVDLKSVEMVSWRGRRDDGNFVQLVFRYNNGTSWTYQGFASTEPIGRHVVEKAANATILIVKC